MAETLTQTRSEEAIARANSFLQNERGTGVDGQQAAASVIEKVTSVSEHAEHLLTQTPHPKMDGFYVPLSAYNTHQYQEACSVLAGYAVLVPSSYVRRAGLSVFYPAIVSEDSAKKQALRLHVLLQPYRKRLRYGSSVVLSAAGQSETKGIGEHGKLANDGLEAEHFAALLAASSDPIVRRDWQAGMHINHAWRNQSDSSVTAEVSKRLFDKQIPQTTVTFSHNAIRLGQRALLWHAGMRDEDTGKPETATKPNALVVIQGLGFEAVRAHNPVGLDQVKRLLQ